VAQGPTTHVRRLSAASFGALFRRAVALRVTTYHLLVGALFLSVREILPHGRGSALPLWCVVDLRRFGVLAERPAPCNLFGLMHVWLPTEAELRLPDAAVRIRDQFAAMQKRFGLTEPPFRLESEPGMRFFIRCLPYSWMRAIVTRRLRGMEAGIHMLTDIGILEDAQLSLRGATTTGAYVASGMARDPRLLLLCVSQFRDTLTITSNVDRAIPMAVILDGMLERLADAP
jgi:hypothetical protein